MLFLVDHRTDLAKREVTKIWVENGVLVQRLASHEFGGEFKRTGKFYLAVLQVVSIWAMITNSAQIIFRLVGKDKSALWKAIAVRDYKKISKELMKLWLCTSWEMGRDPNHISSTFVDRFSRFNHQAKWGAAGWKSLDVFYNYWENVQPKLGSDLEGWLTRFWIERMENRQAVTNRLKIAVNLIADALVKFAKEPEIRLLSIASGSAQADIRAMQRHPRLNIKAVLIDSDQTALNEAKKAIQEAGLEERFTLILGKTDVLEDVCKTFHPHVVEMVGFLDYRPKHKAIELIGRIRNVLPKDGVFITCNICPNPEKIFLNWVLLWPMIYRTPAQLAGLILGGGFTAESVKLFYEPFEIHGIAVAVK